MCFGRKCSQLYAHLTCSRTPATHLEESTFLQKEAGALDEQSYHQTRLTKPEIQEHERTTKF